MKAVKIIFEGSDINNIINSLVTKLHRKKDDCPFAISLPNLFCSDKRCSLGDTLTVFFEKDECVKHFLNFLKGKRCTVFVFGENEIKSDKRVAFVKKNYLNKLTYSNAKKLLTLKKENKISKEMLKDTKRMLEYTIIDFYEKSKMLNEEDRIKEAISRTMGKLKKDKELREHYFTPFLNIESYSSVKKGIEYPYKKINLIKIEEEGSVDKIDFSKFNSYGLNNPSNRNYQFLPLI